jgi:hypothetical protein
MIQTSGLKLGCIRLSMLGTKVSFLGSAINALTLTGLNISDTGVCRRKCKMSLRMPMMITIMMRRRSMNRRVSEGTTVFMVMTHYNNLSNS